MVPYLWWIKIEIFGFLFFRGSSVFHYHSAITVHFPISLFQFISFILKIGWLSSSVETMDLTGCKQMRVPSSSIRFWALGWVRNLEPRGWAAYSGPGSCRDATGKPWASGVSLCALDSGYVGTQSETLARGAELTVALDLGHVGTSGNMDWQELMGWMFVGCWHCRDMFTIISSHTRIQ